MYANNETGVMHPVKEIGAIAKRHKVLFFSDATQAIGKCKVDVIADEIDILAMSAHKFYGPKGIGALYIRRRDPRVSLTAQIDGGGHERGFRSGTLNVPGIVGMGKAAELCGLKAEEERGRLKILRNRLEGGLGKLGRIVINGDTGNRLPNVTNISFEGISAEKLLSLLNGDIAFSLGSACTSASKEPSHVLEAMHLKDPVIRGSIRLSLGRFTTDEDIDKAIQIFGKALKGFIHID